MLIYASKGFQKGKKEGKGIENISEDIMAENFPNLKKKIDTPGRGSTESKTR